MTNVNFKSNLHDRLRVFQGIITKHNEYVTIYFVHQMGGKLNANVFMLSGIDFCRPIAQSENLSVLAVNIPTCVRNHRVLTSTKPYD